MTTLVTGVYNLHGETVAIRDIVATIEAVRPAARGLVSFVDQPMPFADELDDIRYQHDLGPAPRTGLREGTEKTITAFETLDKAERLDARELR